MAYPKKKYKSIYVDETFGGTVVYLIDQNDKRWHVGTYHDKEFAREMLNVLRSAYNIRVPRNGAENG